MTEPTGKEIINAWREGLISARLRDEMLDSRYGKTKANDLRDEHQLLGKEGDSR